LIYSYNGATVALTVTLYLDQLLHARGGRQDDGEIAGPWYRSCSADHLFKRHTGFRPFTQPRWAAIFASRWMDLLSCQAGSNQSAL